MTGDDRSSTDVAGYPSSAMSATRHLRPSRAVDLVVFTMPISARTRILQMLASSRFCGRYPFGPRDQAAPAPAAYSYLGGVPLLDVFDKRWPIGTSS